MKRLTNILVALALLMPASAGIASPALADGGDWTGWTAYRGQYDDWGEHPAEWWRARLEFEGPGAYASIVHDGVFVETDRKSGLVAVDDYCFLPVDGPASEPPAEYNMFVRLNDSYEHLGTVSAEDDSFAAFAEEAMSEMAAAAEKDRAALVTRCAAVAVVLAAIIAALMLAGRAEGLLGGGRGDSRADGDASPDGDADLGREEPAPIFSGWRSATVAAEEAGACAGRPAPGDAPADAVPVIPIIEPVVELFPEDGDGAEPESEPEPEPDPGPGDEPEPGLGEEGAPAAGEG